MKKPEPAWYELGWPREVSPEAIEQAIRLLATMAGNPVVLEAVGMTGGAKHRLALPSGDASGLARQLRVAVPGLAVEKVDERPPLQADRAIEVRLTTRNRSLFTAEVAYVSRALLTALSGLRAGEVLSLTWTLGHQLRPLAVPNRATAPASGSWLKDVVATLVRGHLALDGESRSALRDKQAVPGWRAAGRIGVAGGDAPREHQLVRQVLGALRATEAPGLAYWVRSTKAGPVADAQVPRRLPLRLNVHELGAVSSWPVGATAELPVAKQQPAAGALPAHPQRGTCHRGGDLPGPRTPAGHLG